MSSSFRPKKKQKLSSSFSSSYSEAKWPFDVFLSFRGEDVRHGFLADLHKCLRHGEINVYIDSEDLRRGDEISPALMKAIEESRIAVLVFSEDYASSRWCLDELVKVMECRRLNGQQVLPVFYRVEPREVRGQRESYGKALARHEEKLGKGSERVEKWRQALIEAANLSGWHYDHGDETEFIEKIVKEISITVARVPLSVAKYPVGVGCRVEKVMSLLSMGSDDVWMIGIWGTGGLGKTTIAKDVYNSIASQFDGCSFLANVRETSNRPDGLVHLQKTLLSETLWKENLVVLSEDKGANLIRDRLCCRKILLVLDDVDHGDQLNALARECAWFGKGSRIIVTTRDKHVLTSHGIDRVYEVKPLDQDEASELLSSYALNQTNDISRNLIHYILGYAKGLPLAIVVLGSFLCGRSRGEWESTLGKLSKNPMKDINSVLKISFDALEENERNIFLDIACLFKGRKRNYVTRVLDSYDLDTLIGIQTLIERSLVTIEYDSKVQMHDLIQLMGQDVVKKECLNDPGKRSRLWCYDDVNEVLSTATGTNNVNGIVLQLPKRKVLDISPNAFTHMRRLKVLILSNARISGGLVCPPDDLRWLELHGCHSSTLKFSARPKKLVCFDVSGSQIKKFEGNLKDFENLKLINMSGCQLLVRMPDLNLTPNLEELYLVGCKNLELVHESIAYHGKLWFLKLDGCSKLQSLPYIPVKNEALREISLNETGIKELPASIENFVCLENMSLNGNKKLAILPSTIYNLQNLQKLSLRECSRLKFPKDEEDLREAQTKTRFPMLEWLNLSWCHLSEVGFLENLSHFPNLKYLFLSGNNFTNLPTWEKLYSLENLYASYCKKLQEIPKIPRKLRRLEATDCKSLNRIPCNINVEYVLLHSSEELVRHWLPVNDLFKLENFHCQTNCRIILPGGEMPEWLVPNTEGYISFVASKDTYKKILGVAFSFVFQAKTESSCLEDTFQFDLMGFVNSKPKKHSRYIKGLDSDHVWLEYMESKDLWMVDHFGPNESSHFHISIRLPCNYDCKNNDLIVKKCGFRLICKSLENDLEVLLQENQLLDPILLYEVSHEDNPTSIKEESPSETGDLSETYPKKRGFNMADFSIEKHRFSDLWSSSLGSRCREVHPIREMPKEFVLVEDGTISFMASQGLYNRLAALHFCVVFGVDGKKEVSIDIVPHVNGQRRNVLSGTLGSFDTDHVWFQLFLPSMLWGVLEGAVDFGQFDESYLNFSLNIRVVGATVKKLGYVIQSYFLEDALKVELEEHRLMDQASLLESNNHPFYYGSQRGYY